MPSKKLTTPVEAGCVYHIYNRGHNYNKVFFRNGDYHLFLEKLDKYLSGFCSVYAYVLIPNHYHLLLRVKDEIEKKAFSKQFLKFILSYSNHINWRENRKGNLFLSRFRRIKVENEHYLKRLVFYIHYNPVKHEICEDFSRYYYSSYNAYLSDKFTKISRDEVLNYFGGIEEFLEYHKYLLDEKKIQKFTLEDD